MATETTNYKLLKPLKTENYDVEVFNGNADIIDTKIKENANALETHKADMTSLIKIKKDVNILTSGWVDDTLVSGFWKYEILDVDITTDTMVDVNIDLNDLEKAESIKSTNIAEVGKVTLFADEALTDNISCDLRLTRQVV